MPPTDSRFVLVREAEQRALELGVVDRRDRDGALLPVANQRDLGRLGGLAAVLRLARALVGADLADQHLRVAAHSVDRDHAVALAQHLRSCTVLAERLDLVRRGARGHAPDQQVGDQHHERQHDVDRRAGRDDRDALPHRLAVVGAMLDLRRDLLRRVHAGDLHVAAERDRADRVLGLAAADAAEQRREEQREALDAHADRLGGREVPGLVQDDQRSEAEEGEQPAQARTSTLSAATRRASASAP